VPQITTETNLPAIVAGIETAKKAVAQRWQVIKQQYIKLLEKLQNRNGKKAVFNEYLGVDVYITMHESGKKASNSSAFNWQSTYAVKHLKQ
jgi:hypothetical protein